MTEATERLHSVTEAANAAGVSPTSVRTYTDHYAAHLSSHATGRPRQYTTDDLRTLAFVAHHTAQGRTHDEILDIIIDELDSFGWSAPAGRPTGSAAPQGEEGTALIPMSLLQAAQAMIRDRDVELQRLRDELQVQRGRVEQLQHENGRLSGQLEEVRRPWWKRALGID